MGQLTVTGLTASGLNDLETSYVCTHTVIALLLEIELRISALDMNATRLRLRRRVVGHPAVALLLKVVQRDAGKAGDVHALPQRLGPITCL